MSPPAVTLARVTEHVVAKLEEITVALPGGGQRRSGQIEMTKAIAQAIEGPFHLVARAGTGTGKSLAYLVPAVMSGKTVVIATATKALQDQLADKDLPFLEDQFDLTWAVLKGRANYLCRQRLVELADDRQLALADIAGGDIDAELDQLVEWSEETKTGDRAELPVEPSTDAWNAVSVGSDACPGMSRCPSGTACFAEEARAAAEEADVIVVNTHLYGIHLASENAVLPEHEVAIIDEAHQLEDIISSTCGVEMSAGRFGDLARRAKAIVADDKLIDKIYEAGTSLEDALEGLGEGRIDVGADDELGRALTRARDGVDRLLDALRAVPADAAGDTLARKERAQQGALTLIAEIDACWSATEDDVAYIAGPPNRRSLRISPIDVGETLTQTLWQLPTVILTSATIPDVLPDQLGLTPDSFQFIDVGSPFDYETSALLYCAMDLPEPRSPDFEDAALDELERLIVAAGGRTLALFTSWRALKNAVEVLRPRLPWEILAQGELPKPLLLEQFRGDSEACLFATMSFWQGVDIQGESLSLVTIDKIPFPPARQPAPASQARSRRIGGVSQGGPSQGGHDAGAGHGPAHPVRVRPRRGRHPRPAPRDPTRLPLGPAQCAARHIDGPETGPRLRPSCGAYATPELDPSAERQPLTSAELGQPDVTEAGPHVGYISR